jgi:RNA polymerase sigma-32 factor
MPEKKAPPLKKSSGKSSPSKLKSKLAKPARTAALSGEVLPEERKIAKSPTPSKKSTSVIHYRSLGKPLEVEEDAEESEPSENETDSDDIDGDGPELSDAEGASEETGLALKSIDREIAVSSRAISPSDPLRRYLDEVRHYPLLTPEEEVALATRLHETGDIEAAKRLVQANLRLVVKIAFEYKSVYANVMDLIQEGNIGLMKAVSKYDPTKGAKVSYYSSWWIRSYILKYLLDNFRLVRVGTTAAQKKLFFHLMREKERLESQGVFAGPKLLADRLNVREKDVVEMQKRLGNSGAEVSLDSPVGSESEGGGKGTFVDLLEDRAESTDETLAREQLLGLIRDRLPDFERTLNDRERRILRDRLLHEEPKTLQEVADHYGLTRERARQIEAGVITKLRDFLKNAMR